MATQENIEYLALLKCKVELTSEISAHPLSVSDALVAKGLIPEPVHRSLLIPSKEDSVKASELAAMSLIKSGHILPGLVTFWRFFEALTGWKMS